MKGKTGITRSFKCLLRQVVRRSLPLGPAFLIAFWPAPVRADTIALSFTQGATGRNLDQFRTLGWAFSLSVPVLVTDLGLWADFDVLQRSHTVTIWRDPITCSTCSVLARAEVDSGSLANGFIYVPLASPEFLRAGNYTIGANYPHASPDSFSFSVATVTTALGVIYKGPRSGFGGEFPPGNLPGLDIANSFFGPNFQFTYLPTTPVPETASTGTLLALSMAAICGLRLFIVLLTSRLLVGD